MTPADVQDRDGARLLMAILTTVYGWLKLIWADGGYAGQLVGEVARLKRHRQIDLEVKIEHSEALIYLSMTKRMLPESLPDHFSDSLLDSGRPEQEIFSALMTSSQI